MDLTRPSYPQYTYRYPIEIRYRLSPYDFYGGLAHVRCTCECYCSQQTRISTAAFEREMMEKRFRSVTRSEDRNNPTAKDEVIVVQNQDPFSDKPGRRNRTTYKRWQIEELERAFCLNPYPTSVFKKALAIRLGLRDSRVQVWFQNRRAKAKRDRRGPTTTPIVQNCEVEIDGSLSEDEKNRHQPHQSSTDAIDVTREYTDIESANDTHQYQL